MKTVTLVAAACAIVGCTSFPLNAATKADSQFPTRPVRLIVPVAPGGANDLIARLIAARLSERWGHTMVVDNRPGATGLIGLDLVARATPDGHTLGFPNIGHLVSAQSSGKLSIQRGGDFTPIAITASSVLLLVMNSTVPAKSLKELVELARAKPRQINYASGGAGSVNHLATELFASMAGIELTHVPYQGVGLSVPDLVSGRVQLTLAGGVASHIQHMQAGRLRGLAITGAKRYPTLPDVPTFAEAGYSRFDVSLWFGVFGPARMPAHIVSRLNADLNATMQLPEVADRLAGVGIDVAKALSPAEFADYMAAETIKWNEALKAARIR